MMSYIKGEVKFQVYYNDQNGYGVYKINIDETNEPYFDFEKVATITGTFIPLEIGGNYIFNGKIVFNQKYGYTFITETYERILPTSKDGIIEFLSGESFKGIGKGTATKVVETLGIDTISLILSDKDVLDKVPGMNEKKKNVIYNSLTLNRDISNTLITLYSYGISPRLSMRIYDKFGPNTIDVIKNDPYVLIDEVEGIAFIKADQIALKTGVNLKSPSRIEACIIYTLLNNAQENGDTYLDKDILMSKVKEYLSFTKEDEELINKALDNLIFTKRIYEYENGYIESRLYNSEKYIAKKLLQIHSHKCEIYNQKEIESLIKTLENKLDIKYEDEQKEAIYNALNNNFSIITGGPGTGKTTIERGIIFAFKELSQLGFDYIKLAAPTGKAAKRIEESTGYFASTIHKLLGYDTLGNFYYNRFNTLPVKLLIIDEASMIDTFLFKNLLEAIDETVRLVIVGDADQLPSIGPGQILKDLIDLDYFKTTKLKKIHRQKENSKIISLAYDVLDGNIQTELDAEHDELVFIPSRQGDLLPNLKNIVDHYTSLGYDMYSDIQILIPIYKGTVGIEVVNRFMQMNFNTSYNGDSNESLDRFYIDDKVIQLTNQYEDGVMNGDMGIVADKISDKEVVVDFQNNLVNYKDEDLSNISLAYSISIHKSQGSEFKVVIIPFFNNYRILLNKKLVYTAITRAKEHLVLVGDPKTFRESIKISSCDRKTTIKSFIE